MQKYNELTFTNDFMFQKILTGNPQLCREILEACIGHKLEDLITIDCEKTIRISANAHGVRLDVIAENNKAIFSAEMQNANVRDPRKRSRFYHSSIDSFSLVQGVDYSELKEVYVIFFCNFDLFGKGRFCYSFQMKEETNPSLNLEDGQHTIFLNFSKSTYSEETKKRMENASGDLENLLLYFSGERRHNALVDKMDSALESARSNETWKGEFMTFEELQRIAREEGLAEGRAEGKALGRAEGKEEGKAEGRQEGRKDAMIEFAGRLIAQNKMTDAEIAALTDLKIEDVAGMRKAS